MCDPYNSSHFLVKIIKINYSVSFHHSIEMSYYHTLFPIFLQPDGVNL